MTRTVKLTLVLVLGGCTWGAEPERLVPGYYKASVTTVDLDECWPEYGIPIPFGTIDLLEAPEDPEVVVFGFGPHVQTTDGTIVDSRLFASGAVTWRDSAECWVRVSTAFQSEEARLSGFEGVVAFSYDANILNAGGNLSDCSDPVDWMFPTLGPDGTCAVQVQIRAERVFDAALGPFYDPPL